MIIKTKINNYINFKIKKFKYFQIIKNSKKIISIINILFVTI